MARKAGAAKKQKAKPKLTDKEQSERFKQTARELGVDESGKHFEQAFSEIVKPKPARPAGFPARRDER
jgi:uncharacterized protein YgbK (DUF1537 family)